MKYFYTLCIFDTFYGQLANFICIFVRSPYTGPDFMFTSYQCSNSPQSPNLLTKNINIYKEQCSNSPQNISHHNIKSKHLSYPYSNRYQTSNKLNITLTLQFFIQPKLVNRKITSRSRNAINIPPTDVGLHILWKSALKKSKLHVVHNLFSATL